MTEFASATIVLRRHDGSSVEIDIPHGNRVTATSRARRGTSGHDVTAFGTEPPIRVLGFSGIEIHIEAEFTGDGPSTLATQTIHAAEERA